MQRAVEGRLSQGKGWRDRKRQDAHESCHGCKRMGQNNAQATKWGGKAVGSDKDGFVAAARGWGRLLK